MTGVARMPKRDLLRIADLSPADLDGRQASQSSKSASAATPIGECATLREIRAFRVALAVILLAVADDAFVHPEAGTGAANHLVSGLVPLAIGIGLVLAYPRLRAGRRAV